MASDGFKLGNTTIKKLSRELQYKAREALSYIGQSPNPRDMILKARVINGIKNTMYGKEVLLEEKEAIKSLFDSNTKLEGTQALKVLLRDNLDMSCAVGIFGSDMAKQNGHEL